MNKKKFITLLLSFIVIIATYNLIVFLVRKNNEISFWLSYAMIMFSVVMLMITFILTNLKDNHKKVVGLNIKTLSFYYLILELIMGTIFMFFPNILAVAVIIPHSLITAIFLLIYIPCALQFISIEDDNKNNEINNEN